MLGLEIADASNGLLKLGTVYVTLAMLEGDELISSRAIACPPGRARTRLYKITDKGRRERARCDSGDGSRSCSNPSLIADNATR